MSKLSLSYRMAVDDLKRLYSHLEADNFEQKGPVIREGVIMLKTLRSFDQMPVGYHEQMSKGHYRLTPSGDGSFFQYTVGPQSFKKFLYPPRQKLWSASKSANGFTIDSGPASPPKMAFWGIRSCELKAIEILDKIFLRDNYVNQWYQKARENLFVVAVGCTSPSEVCFCTSTDTGPKPDGLFDLSLTEVLKKGKHYFLCEVGSKKGEQWMARLQLSKASDAELAEAAEQMAKAEQEMPVRFDTAEASKMLKNNPEHPQWDDVAQRCMSCANCTLVCPTCFCSTTEDVTDLTGNHTERWIRWDSCFNGDFSYIHGGMIRSSTRSRYRQWLTHKLSNWYDQFGASGCVGCGRCITWCPVGIDLIEELQAIQSE